MTDVTDATDATDATDTGDTSNRQPPVVTLPQILVDVISLTSAPLERLKLGLAEGPDGDADLARFGLSRGQRVLFLGDEIAVEGTVDFEPASGVAYWLGGPAWGHTASDAAGPGCHHPLTRKEPLASRPTRTAALNRRGRSVHMPRTS